MKGLLGSVLKAPLNSYVQSATVKLSGIGTGVPFQVITGSVYLSGNWITSATTGTKVSDGSQFYIQVRTSTAYATPVFSTIKIGDQFYTFTAVTIDDPTLVFDAAKDNLLPFDIKTNVDGTPYVPALSLNKLTSYTSAGSVSRIVSLNAPTANASKISDSIMIADYFRDTLYVINSTYTLIAAVATGVGSKPYGIAATKTTADDDSVLNWVTLSGSNQVVAYTAAYAAKFTFNVGMRPMGIAASPDGNHVYVANYGSNTISHFAFANDAWTQTVIAVGSKPFEIAIDASGRAWVTCVGEDNIYRVSSDNSVTSFVTGKQGHRGIAADSNGVIWIAASESDAVIRMDANGTVLSSISVEHTPFAVAVSDDGASVGVTCLSDSPISSNAYSAVFSYTLAGALIRRIGVDKYPYGIAYYAGYMLIANMYSNTPQYYNMLDQTVQSFAIVDPEFVGLGSLVQSNVVTISGLNTPVPISIPDVLGAKLYKNGVAVGLSSTVVNGDVVYFEFTAPTAYSTDVDIPIVVGNFYESFTATTQPEHAVPDAFNFKAIVSANPGAEYSSDTIKIVGMSNTTVVPFTTDTGVIVLNGTAQATKTVNVTNGDQIRLIANAVTADLIAVFAKVTVGRSGLQDDGTPLVPYQTTWSIFTKNPDADNLWLKPDFKLLGEYEPFIPTSAITQRGIARIRNKAIEHFTINDTVVAYDAAKLSMPSVFDGALYSFNGASFDTVKVPNDSAPKLLDIAENRYAIYCATNRFVDLQTGEGFNLPALPRKIIYSAALNTVYISLANGSIVALRKATPTSAYTNQIIQVGGSPGAMVIDSANALLVCDSISGKITKLVSNVVNSTFVGAGQGVFDMTISGSNLFTANGYDNTLSKIDLNTKVATVYKLNSAPTQIQTDADGSIWVAMPALKTIQNFDSNGAKISEVAMTTATTFMTSFAGDIYVTELYPNQNDLQARYAKLNPLLLAFGSTTDELRLAHVISPKIVVANLMRPADVFIEPNNGYDLYVNDVLIVSGKATLNNGDIVYLDVLTPNLYFAERIVTVNNSLSSNTFSVRTESASKPDFMAFLDVYDALPRFVVSTEGVTVSGLTEGQPVLLSAVDEQWKISINGANSVPSSLVQNGDVVRLVGPPHQSYSTVRTYTVAAGKHGYVCGSLTVHTVILVGPTFNDRSPTHNSPKAVYEKREHRNWSSFAVSGKNLFVRAARRSRKAVDNVRVFERNSSADFIISEKSSYQKRTRNVPDYIDIPSATPGNNKTRGLAPVRSFAVLDYGIAPTVAASKFVKKAIPDQRTVSPNFVILEYGIPHVIDQPVPFIRSDIYGQRTIGVEWEIKKRVDTRRVSMNPMVMFPQVGKKFVPFDDPLPFKLVRTQKTVQSPAFIGNVRTLVVVKPPSFIRTERTITFSQTPKFARLEQSNGIIIQNPYVKLTYVLRKGPEASFMRNARATDRLIATQFEKISPQQDKFITAKYQRNASPTVKFIEANYRAYGYVIHNYTFAETASIRGGYASAAEAVQAGVDAGYANAYAVQVQIDCYVWATPIDEGDFCGYIPPVSDFAQPKAWHMQGG